MKELFNGKKAGFWVLLAAMVFAVVTLIAYPAVYGSTRFMSWTGFWFMLGGLALSCILVLCRQERFAPSAMLAGSFVSFLYYVYNIYFFISSVVTGIQFSGFPPEFFLVAACFCLTLVLSIAAVFMKQSDKA